jgi:putative membrane protein insertion efficiency factor
MNLKFLLQLPIHTYRMTISPLLLPSCRYRPSCSAYALEALEKHGAVKGTFLTCARVLRCHPLSRRCGHDPVPEAFAWRDLIGYKRRHSLNPARQDKA